MSTEPELIQKRQEVRDEILALKDQIPSAWILNAFGKAFKQNSLGYWLANIILLNLILLSPWVIIGSALKEFEKTIPLAKEIIVGAELPIIGLVVAHIIGHIALNDIANRVVGKISTVDNLLNISQWFKKTLSAKSVFTFTLSYCLLRTLLGLVVASNTINGFAGFGYMLTTVLVGLLSGLVLYFPTSSILLLVNLKEYKYEMNVFSPADSEIISDISEMSTKFLYIGASTFAVTTLIGTSKLYDERAISLPLLVFGWIIILTFFLVTRSTLGTITNRAKWKTLNRIRDKINAIEATGDLSDKDTAERLLRLADIHKQIMASKKDLFDLNSALTLFSQLLLPLLGLLLGSWDKILGWLQ